MKFEFENANFNMVVLARKMGYRPLGLSDKEDYAMVRQLSGRDYPRFHIYIKSSNNALVFNLHLDHKKPSYGGSHAHSGEYEGEFVEAEAERIKEILANNN